MDILHYNLPVYGEEADDLIRKISVLTGIRETESWWEAKVGWAAKPDEALLQAKLRYSAVFEKAKDEGWQLPEDFS